MSLFGTDKGRDGRIRRCGKLLPDSTRGCDCSSHASESIGCFISKAQHTVGCSTYPKSNRKIYLQQQLMTNLVTPAFKQTIITETRQSKNDEERVFWEVGEMQSAPPHRDLLSAGDVPRTAHGPHTTGTVPAGAASASSAACTRPCVRPCVVSNYADRCFCTLRSGPHSPGTPSRCSVSHSLHFTAPALFENMQLLSASPFTWKISTSSHISN